MDNFVKEGDVVTLTAPSGGVTSGTGYLIGSLFVVAVADAAESANFEGLVTGVVTLPKTGSQAWTEGQKIYWNNAAAGAGGQVCTTDSTAGQLIGVANVAAANPSSTGTVRLNGAAPATAEGAQGAIAALTDSSGLSDTHDDTIAAMAAITTITDSSGYDATHNDTVAATAAITVITENGGAVGGTNDSDLPELVDPNGDAGAAVIAAIRELSAKANELVAREAVHAQNVSNLAQKTIELVARERILAQNESDLAQKINEIRTALIAAGILASA